MYITTKNFLLYLLSMAFLLIAITATVVYQNGDGATPTVLADQSVGDEVVYGAAVSTQHTLDRGSQVTKLRERIAALQAGAVALVADDAPVPDPVESVTPPVLVSDIREPLLCPAYAPASTAWPSQGVQLAVVEGARLVFTESVEPMVIETGTSSLPAVTPKTVLLQLALLRQPSATPYCLPSDVIGVALDGSLMRNTETGLYGIFGADTLLGYALDGFPIYGQGETVTDSCGGSSVDGQYRYTLSAEREGLLNCFAGQPAAW